MNENNFEKIKKLMKIVGGKAIIIEDGEPAFVIINIDEYIDFNKTENIANHSKNDAKHSEEKEEDINRNVEIWKTKQTQKRLKQFKAEDNFTELGDEEIMSDEITVEKL
jgi:PHD/YefM family antitoxin component YafN of YafNO toxin-antitoxin module